MSAQGSPRVQRQRSMLVAWANEQDMLRDHIRNGCCRGLYSTATRDLALRSLEAVLEIETDNLIDMAEDAAVLTIPANRWSL